MRIRSFLTELLVALLLLQWGTAFGHCLAMAAPAGGLQVEICSIDGARTLDLTADLAADGQDAPGRTHPPAMLCPVCAGPGSVALPVPEVALAPPLLLVQAADPPPAPADAPSPPPRSCRPPPRAPPTS